MVYMPVENFQEAIYYDRSSYPIRPPNNLLALSYMVPFEFMSNGTAGPYELPIVPLAESNLIIFVNGIFKNTTDFTLNENNVTLNGIVNNNITITGFVIKTT